MVPRDLLNQVKDCRVLGEDVLNCSDHLPVLMCMDVGELLPTTIKAIQSKIPKWNKVSEVDLRALYTSVVDLKDAKYTYLQWPNIVPR